MLYTFGILAVLGAIYELCTTARSSAFRKKLSSLQANAHISNGTVSHVFPEGLPVPVVSYLKKATTQNDPVISLLSIHHSGYFRTALNKPWTPIRGKEYFSANPPGFLWQGNTELFTAVDLYLNGKGELSVWLFSAIRLFSKKGSAVDSAERGRWIGECVLFPSSLFPSKQVHWETIDTTTALLHYKVNSASLSFTVRFNSHNEVETIETKRFMGNKMERWIGAFKNYKSVEGYWLPTLLEASWIINGMQYPYARFEIEKFEINSRHI